MTQIPILLYHQITDHRDADDPFHLSVSPEKFKQQMQHLADKGYRCVSLKDALAQKAAKTDQRKTFAVTFDDGYLDNYAVAYPILKELGFVATIFTITDFIGRSLSWPGARQVSFMNWSQMREMAADGFDFGAHTQTHPNLPDITAQDALREIEFSKHILEDGLKQPVTHFAYPGGHQTAEIQQFVRNTGFSAGLGVDVGDTDPFNVWRIQINGSDSMALFRLKTCGYFEQLKRFRKSSNLAHTVTQVAGSLLNGRSTTISKNT